MSLFDMYNINYYGRLEDKRVVLLQSGGLDSCVLASLFHKLGYEIHHLFVDYGFNSAERDLKNVKNIVNKYGGELHIVKMDMPWLKDSTNLVGSDIVDDSSFGSDTMNTYYSGTYVPMRNTFLLSIASSLCESLKIPYIATALDGIEDLVTHKPLGGTSDKHPTYVRKLEDAINEGSSEYHLKGKSIHILTPIMNMIKQDTIVMGEILNTDFSLSNSCYSSTEQPCGVCSACIARKEAFEEVGIEDPLLKKYSNPIDFTR